MSDVTISAQSSPIIDVSSDKKAAYEEDLRAASAKSKEPLYEETKEWCTLYRCRYEPGIVGSILAYLDKLLDSVLNMALTIIYAALDALLNLLFSTVGVVAKLVDEVLIITCYMFFSDNSRCCDKSRILDAILDFIADICDGIAKVMAKILEILINLIRMKEKLLYSCECERLESELQEQYKPRLDAARQEYGNKYKEYKAVFKYPDPRKSDTYYLLIRGQPPGISPRFKMHVANTVEVYNKWPYGAVDNCPAAIMTNAIAYISWKMYVQYLVSMWLSTSNLWSASNTSGYSVQEHNEMLKYCESHMPRELYNYVLYSVTNVPDYEETIKKGMDS